MQDDEKILEVEPTDNDVLPTRKVDTIKLSTTPSDLLSKEGFALYVGKTPNAVVCMAKAGKLPSFYMVDPLKPGGNAELWINRKEWDKYAAQLVETAPAEWHGWKDRLSAGKPRNRKSAA
ncbi:Cox family DNA-binding protein [Rahnella sp. ChDrAdgB13]|uniref:Cox family DNA-binding protein n=1 Tax=Rahnella sp. ChDrAdgB13 TaxID=1850581 RepID=UPI001AD86689|nr:Cox family DNA-binding protein [Rahnella sp. ChDrAdgB13]